MTTTTKKALFTLGQVVATPDAIEALEKSGTDALALLARHVTGDWGDELDPEDRAANDRAVDVGTRILSAYNLPDYGRIWIITEWDRCITTLLLPEEY